MESYRTLSDSELSALCSNLAKACSKQQQKQEESLFDDLARYWESSGDASGPADSLDALMPLILEDLKTGYPEAKESAIGDGDRASLRALVWGEKVTKLLKSLQSRRNALKGQMHVYVCEICGFVAIAEAPPEICPICKAPRFRFTEIKKEAV
jgi:rubrerythrin